MSQANIRVLSDLHIGHRASLVRDPSRLRPLIDGADVVIFNGDTIELKFDDLPQKANDHLSPNELAKLIKSWGAEAVFITGNHDPAISQTHHLLLGEGKVLITHGDACFKSIAPWSSESKILAEEADKLASPQSELSQKHSDLHSYLSAIKAASINAHNRHADYDPTLWGRFSIFLHQAWPPTRPFRILRAWRDMPQASYKLAKTFGLEPSLILVGHTHQPFAKKIQNTHVLNTGSFFPWPGAFAVDFNSSGTSVRKILKSRRGLKWGAVEAQLPQVLTSADLAQF